MQRETGSLLTTKRVIDKLNAKGAQKERILLNRRPVPEHSIHRHWMGVLIFLLIFLLSFFPFLFYPVPQLWRNNGVRSPISHLSEI